MSKNKNTMVEESYEMYIEKVEKCTIVFNWTENQTYKRCISAITDNAQFNGVKGEHSHCV